MVIGGRFTQFDGTARNPVARLNGATVPSFTSPMPGDAIVGVAYSHQFTASGFPLPTFRVSSGSMPPGLTLDGTTGLLAGTPTTAGTFKFTVKVSNYVSPSATRGLTFTVKKARTTTTIVNHLPNPSDVGEAVQVRYQVSGDGATGSVVVSDGTVACTDTVAAGPCFLTFTTPGVKTLVATYAGDSNYNGSSSAGALHIVTDPAKEDTTTITAHTPDPSAVGQAVTVQHNVTSASGTPTGNVIVGDGTVSCTGTVASGSCALTFTTVGTRTLTATYVGDATYNGSVSSVEHTVSYMLYLPLVVRKH